MSVKILFLDDRWRVENWKDSFDEWLPEAVEAIYEEYGYKAVQRLTENPDVKLVFLDLQFEGQPQQGEEILTRIKEQNPDLPVVILTSINDAQLALKLVHDEKKAYYYFFKDSIDPDQVTKVIENAIEGYELKSESIRKTDIGIIVGDSPALAEVLRLSGRASHVDSTVLITGESGTGKELIARAIHLNSRRRKAPFVAVNCGGIPEALIESELFGHVRGAFTGAIKDKSGRFERANKGTIFLDEIAELNPAMQVRLLRVLQFGEIERLGSERTQIVDARVIAATKQNIEERIRDGFFREDLYYRLDVIRIHIPPLRERKEDIPVLVTYFLRRLNDKLDEAKDISDEAIELLQKYHWPGNVRELENLLERAIATSTTDVLDIEDFASLLSATRVDDADARLIDIWVEKAMSGTTSWDDIRREFGAAGDTRKRIIESIIQSLSQKLKQRPSGTELATVLRVSRNHLSQILSSLGLQLRDF
jgi:DNA-binding NtrC family response regulator